MSAQGQRQLPWQWSAIAKCPVTTTNLANGGGVVYGLIAINLTAGQLFLGIFNPATAATAPSTSDLVTAYPIPASGSIVINPVQGGAQCEANKNLNWFVYGGTDPTVVSTTALN